MSKPIEIWSPKYSTNEALIGTHHVKNGINEIIFTKAKHLEGKTFVMTGEKIRSYKKQPNGRGFVYCVPMKDLHQYDETCPHKLPYLVDCPQCNK